MVRKEELEFVPLELAGVVRDVVQLLHSDAILRNSRVALQAAADLPAVRGDRVQLQQVILNLLLNAFEAMKDCPMEDREVIVHAELDGANAIRVAVSDCGIGLSNETLDEVFQPFYTTKRDGLGMGLPITRSIIEAHGRRLWSENNPDRGATFYFTLPTSSSSDHRIASSREL